MLRVSADRRHLVNEQGLPFFYIGDTAWELFHRLNREEAAHYLAVRASQNFTAIQAVILAEFEGIREPNAYGHLPLLNDSPATPNEPYFEHCDFIVRTATQLGLYMSILPTWGRHLGGAWPSDVPIFDEVSARSFGRFLANRYKDALVIWVLGGDRPVKDESMRRQWRAMAEGIREMVGDNQLITFHPAGGSASWHHVGEETWIDFHTIQSGHSTPPVANYAMLQEGYARPTIKPVLDSEPCYEDHPIMTPKWGWEPGQGWFDEHDVRRAAYWALLAGGACGHTYGCHDIWQMWEPKHQAVNNVRTPWTKAMHLPGANQMRHVRAVFESRNPLLRTPDHQLVKDPLSGLHFRAAARASDGSYAFVYLPTGMSVSVRPAQLSGNRVKASWFDPRYGTQFPAGEHSTSADITLTPPTSGAKTDWLLILDAV